MATTSTSGISFSGLSSGLDTDSIITALTSAETTQKAALQSKQDALTLRQTAYATVKAQMSSIAQAAGTLNTASTYATVQGTVADTDIATLSTTASANVGDYDLVVSALAKANKLGSAAQTDTTTALGKTGTVAVNGKALKIVATDSLTAIAKNINGLSAGVTASVVDGGTGRAYLTLSSGSTGTANAVSVADLSGTAMQDLGLVGTGSAIRQSSGATAVGYGFSSETTSIGSVLGASGLAASTITVGNATINVDPSTDTLQDLATRINAAGVSGVTATVQAGTTNGATTYSLQISGAGTDAVPLSDTGGVLEGLGVLRATPANTLVAAQDASFTLDGVALTSATNAVTGVISGATLTLKKAGETDVSLAKDTSAVTTGVNNLVTAANNLFSTITQYSSFDTSTYDTGVLFGDSIANQAKDSVRTMLFSDAPGATGTYKNLASVGLGLDTSGNVTFDQDAFNTAMDTDPASVQALLQSVGTGSDSTIKYVSATSTAKASTSGPYAVNITQVATQASFVAGTAETSARTAAETLTFRGSAFGSSGIAVDMEAGTDLSDTVAKINGDSRLKDLVTASVEDGKLRIDAKKYGSVSTFTLTSNYASSTSNSGVGVGGEGTSVAGLDVAGTIANEAATGAGQFLTGATGNSNTAGLQILYSGTATGAVGTIAYSRGEGARMTDLINSFTDSTNGLFTAVDTSLQTQIDGLTKEMTASDDALADKTADLKQRFAAMETAIANLKAQSSTVESELGTSS